MSSSASPSNAYQGPRALRPTHEARQHPLGLSCHCAAIPMQRGVHPHQIAVPAQSHREANDTLHWIGTGSFSTGLHQTYLGTMLPQVREAYYHALEKAEQEITFRKASLGSRLNNPAEYEAFVRWASARRTSIARVFRLPTGIGTVIGGEIRDTRKYGFGGRSFDNLMLRQAARGVTGRAAVTNILHSVDKPNLAVTEQMLKTAKVLRGGGAVLFVGGLALSGYEIYQATPQERPALVKKTAATMGAALVASEIAVGIALMLSAPAVAVIAVGLVVGGVAAYETEQIFFTDNKPKHVQALKTHGILHFSDLIPAAH